MFDRTKAVEDKLLACIQGNDLNISDAKSYFFDDTIQLKLVEIFESQIVSRLLDLKARKLRVEGKSFYTIGSSGHEVMAVVGELTRLTDMAFLHYRDASLLIQRSKKIPGHSILFDLLLSFCAGKEDPISGGRHKVLGHKNLHIPPQTSTIASHLPKALGTAYSILKAKKINSSHSILPDDAIVVCSFGDASFNHASAQTTFNCAQWISYQNMSLPLIFICEDNGIGISVKTPNHWIRETAKRFSHIQYFECNGLDLMESYSVVKEAIEYTRTKRRPTFLRIKTVRLMGHAGSDIEMVYRTPSEIENSEKLDPIIKSISLLLKNNILSIEEIQKIYFDTKDRIDRVAQIVLTRPKLQDATEIMTSVVPKKLLRETYFDKDQNKRKLIFDKEWDQLSQPQTMGKLLNWGLVDILHNYKEAVVFGEDVGKKGGVYNVTANLQKRFGIIKSI
jgi:2-oxoisovalerate dehydrogenase E1 component